MSLKIRYEDVPSEAQHYFREACYQDNRYLLRNTTALYDPIFTPIFTAVWGAAGVGLTGTALNVAVGLSTAIASTAISIGIQALMAPKPPKVEAGKNPVKQAIPYRMWAVGRVRMAGAMMLFESVGGTLHAVQAIVAHRIKSFNRYWLHDDLVEIDGSGNVISPDGTRYSNEGVRIQTRLGLPTETVYAPAVDAFSSSGLWTNNHRGDGQASVYMRALAAREREQSKYFPYHIPQLSVELDGAYCWDFRDPEQDPDDSETWGWTQNSAIICAWHLCFNEFGFREDYTKALLPYIDLWREEADICDEDVAVAGGGTHKRYRCNGWDTAENGPKSGLNAILATCDGHLVKLGNGGRVLTVGKFRESRCSVLTDDDIVGHSIQNDVPFEEECNRLVPKFTYPDTDYTTTDTDFFEDTDAQIKAGRILTEEGDYSWCHDWRQARRIAKRDWLRLRQKVKGSLDVRLSGINAVYARWVRMETPNRIPRLDGKLIENRRSVLALTRGGFTMDFVLHPEDIEDWNPATDEGAQPPVPEAPNAAGILTPVINLVQAKANGSSVYIRVVIIDPEDDSLTPVVYYRLADAGSGSPGPWIEKEHPDAVPSGGFVDLATDVVPSDQELEIEVAFKTSGGSFGDHSTTATVTSTADPVAPAVVTSASATGGAGQATFAWTAPNSANYVGAQLYWNTSNTIVGATQWATVEYGAPSSVNSRVVTGISAGTRYGFIKSVNGSGVASTQVATGAFTVT